MNLKEKLWLFFPFLAGLLIGVGVLLLINKEFDSVSASFIGLCVVAFSGLVMGFWPRPKLRLHMCAHISLAIGVGIGVITTIATNMLVGLGFGLSATLIIIFGIILGEFLKSLTKYVAFMLKFITLKTK